MWINNLNPVLVHIGPLEIRYYGLVYVLGFIATYVVYEYLRKKGTLKLSKEDVENLLLYMMIGTIVGSRLGELLWEPGYYLSNPLNIFKIWQGGMSFHGGLTGLIIANYLFAKKHNISFWNAGEPTILVATFALAFGRIANFINGELWGTVTNVPWCVVFPAAGPDCRHPVQIYGFIGRFIAGLILVYMYRKQIKEGFTFFMFLVLLGIGRFFTDFLREDSRWLGLSMGQYLSAIMFIVGIYFIAKYYREDVKNIFSKEDSDHATRS